MERLKFQKTSHGIKFANQEDYLPMDEVVEITCNGKPVHLTAEQVGQTTTFCLHCRFDLGRWTRAFSVNGYYAVEVHQGTYTFSLLPGK